MKLIKETRRTTMSEWISVNDRLPTKKDYKYLWVNDNYENVVLWYDDKDGTIGIGGYVNGYVPHWTDINHDRIDGVTHWMPLPEPPTP